MLPLERSTHGLALESVNRLQLSLDIVVDGLEGLEELLSLGDDVLVLEDGSVVLKVDGLGRLRVGRVGEASVGSTLPERRQSSEGLCCGVSYGVRVLWCTCERFTAHPCGVQAWW